MISAEDVWRLIYLQATCRIKNKGKNNVILTKGSFLKRTNISIKGNNNTVIIGSSTSLYKTNINISGDGHSLLIGNKCKINKSCIVFKDDGCTTKIGDNTTSEGTNIVIHQYDSMISIGKDCMLSHETDIRNGDAHSVIDLKTRSRVNFGKDIVIGDHVWIGAYSKILKGSVLEDDCIIGMGSIVTGQVRKNTISAGVPAREIRNDITWIRQRICDTGAISDELLWKS